MRARREKERWGICEKRGKRVRERKDSRAKVRQWETRGRRASREVQVKSSQHTIEMHRAAVCIRVFGMFQLRLRVPIVYQVLCIVVDNII